ncbi:ATP-binding protein [Streptomyces sp. NA04227]|uniref:ATP-binding protein n=1 Tax=Streptomyces sp. NA04227 TaxID=2742136 RepID=UPI0015922326|nr:ATP-binding protein [Streptomyces sp. NA04227]QKW07090.1 ATP-binding protein [Streptomyces sp. NA04227]
MTNSVRHARTSPGREISTEFSLTPARLRVAVSDACDVIPEARRAEEDDEGGRGLALVALLSSRWEVAPRRINAHCTIGKTVWFELDR